MGNEKRFVLTLQIARPLGTARVRGEKVFKKKALRDDLEYLLIHPAVEGLQN